MHRGCWRWHARLLVVVAALLIREVPAAFARGSTATAQPLMWPPGCNSSATGAAGGRVRASCFTRNGVFEPGNVTAQLQAALNSSAGELFIDLPIGVWFVGPLFIRQSNMRIVFQPDITLLAREDDFHGAADSLIRVDSVKNVSIEGNGATLQMRRDDYAIPRRGTCPRCRPYIKSEWRHGLRINQSNG
eukprot:COSAG05_NODE_6602_length_931_cov_18.248798_1_plen_188_part_10